MRIGFLTDGRLADFAKGNCAREAELYCLAFGSVGEIDYEKEVRGEGCEMEEIALFSKHFDCAVVAGCYTSAKGFKRKSAVVADKGKIVGISDMTATFDGEKYTCGSGICVYETSAGKIGVLVGQDVFFPELVKSLSQCGSDVVVCAYEHVGENIEQILLRADAFRYGVPMCMCAHGYAQIAETNGKLNFASPQSPCYCTTDSAAEYHLVQTRRRGFYRPQEVF